MEFLQGIGSKTGAMPLSNNIMYLFHIRPEAPGANFAGQDQAQLFKERLAPYGSYVAEIAASLSSASDIVYSPIEPLMLPWPWHRGRVVIGGDASNDVTAPPRAHSTSDQVEKLAQGADAIVHSTMHPILGPDKGSGFPPPVFYRQSMTTDLGAMAKRVGAKHLMLTHLGPPIGAVRQGPWKIPGGPLTEADYRKAVEASGFTGNTIVGVDLATLRLPAK